MPYIENTTITPRSNGGYRIAPIEGYVLHDKDRDFEIVDEDTMEPTGEIGLGYVPYPVRCGVSANYNFSDTKIIDGHTAYGSREFFARPQAEYEAILEGKKEENPER